MKKDKVYKNTRFSAEVLREAFQVTQECATRSKAEITHKLMIVDHADSAWHYDTFDEFLADYRRFNGHAVFHAWGSDFGLLLRNNYIGVETSIMAPSRVDIEAVSDVLEKHAAQSRLPAKPLPPPENPVVFIGHGRSSAWRDLKDHLHDKHDIRVEAYETGARAGHTIRDVLEEMIKKTSFAILVMTGEDEQSDSQLRARQNVIHEAGLFQGRFGFSRAILLLEEGVEEFSNVQGVQYIRFSKNNIKETFGEVLATLRREFP